MLPPFQVFMDANRDAVWRFCAALAGAEEADDCFQETFLAALRAYPDLAGRRDGREHRLRSWVLQIAHSKAIDAHRGRARRPKPTADVPDGAAAPVAARDQALWGLVRRLPDKQREAVMYRFVEDLAYADIARQMSCTAEAARRNVHEGVRKLREVLA